MISIVIPTYKRLPLLQRAVQSVLDQRFADWELIISDDEDPPGETWRWLESLNDPRIRVLRNAGEHGQCGNVTNAMRQARGEWIKFLYDDDLLRPNCLAVFHEAVKGLDGVVMVSCTVAEYRDGRCVRDGVHHGPLLVLVRQKYVPLGMYLQDEVGGGVPTQVMVRRKVMEQGVSFDAHPGLHSNVDSLFESRVGTLGDSLIIRVPLVEFHQGEHESVTTQMTQEKLDAEYILLRELQLPLIDPSLHPPSLQTVTQMLHVIRAVHRASRRQFGAATRLMVQSWRPQAWWLATKWLLRRRYPNRFPAVPKQILDDSHIRKVLADGPR